MENEKIYVFDAYGTLFDVDHACKEMAIQLGDNWNKLSSIWRQKQLEYSWLHNSMNQYVSFWKITKDSLEYAMNSLSINSVKIKNELLDLYFKIGAFEEVEEVLKKIKKNPRDFVAQPLEILSTIPTICENGIEPRHLDLRPFILTGKTSYVTTGGLTRVALRKGSTIVNSSQGGGSKDTMVVDA